MKLQKQLSRKVGHKEYAKYVIVVPPAMIKESGLKEGDEIDIEIRGKKIVVKKSS